MAASIHWPYGPHSPNTRMPAPKPNPLDPPFDGTESMYATVRSRRDGVYRQLHSDISDLGHTDGEEV